MRIVCILCENAYQPDKWQQKKLDKYPHLIQICPTCAERIATQTASRGPQSASND